MPVLVMELVPGETLSDRVKRGPLPLNDVLRIGQQVAEALAAAHEKGVLHRDLKPANICLTPEGRVKVLDFGLARALSEDEPPIASHLSTATSPPSHAGLVLGTAPYMSPEQARGKEVDRRSDVWAFGCVLYELLCGRRAFPGTSFSEAAAAILEREPDWVALPEGTPYALQRLLKRCLKKDRDERLHDIADAGLELKELLVELTSGAALAGPGEPLARPSSKARRAVVVTALVFGISALAGLFAYRSHNRTVAGPTRQPRFQLTLPRGVVIPAPGPGSGPSYLAVSPDGDLVAFVGCKGGVCLLYVRDGRELDARPLPDTEGASCPFFSPDGRSLGFGANGKLKRIAVEGGSVVTIADAAQLRGGSWGEDGTILFTHGRGGLLRVAADGGEARQVTQPDPAREAYHCWPHFLPGGRAALFNVVHKDLTHDVALADLAAGRVRTLVETAGCPRYASSGHLLFGRHGTLYAAGFDLDRLALTGPSMPVLEGVAMWNSPSVGASSSGNVYYDLAREGTLLFSPLEARLPKRTLVWVDRRGGKTPVSPSQRSYESPRLSPDGRSLAVSVEWDVASNDVFVLDLQRDAWTRVTSGGQTGFQAWLPDGERLLASSSQDGRLALLLTRVDSSASPEALVEDGQAEIVAVAPDGRSLLFCRQPAPAQWDIWQLPLEGDRIAKPWLATPSSEASPSFSPDGRFVAYRSSDSGRAEIYVRPYPGPGPRHQVSAQGGNMPRWSRDGREIFFTWQESLWAAAVRTSQTFVAEAPRELFKLPEEILVGFDFYDVTADGQRFVMVQKDPFELRPIELALIPNWLEELKARMAAAH